MELKIAEAREEELVWVAGLANKCRDFPYLEDDFHFFFQDPAHCCCLAKTGQDLVGYLILAASEELRILDLGVRPKYRGKKASREMLRFVAHTASKLDICRITVIERERELKALQWLRHMGFRCVHILPNHFEDVGEHQDGFLFVADAPQLEQQLPGEQT